MIVLVVVASILFSSTHVAIAPAYVVILGFGLLAGTIYYFVYCLIGLSGFYGLKITRQRTLALFMTVVFGFLVALQSVGELSPRDIWVLLPLAVIGYFYSTLAKTSKS